MELRTVLVDGAIFLVPHDDPTHMSVSGGTSKDYDDYRTLQVIRQVIVNTKAREMVDVGAYVGRYSIAMAEAAKYHGGRVLAIEPDRDLCTVLRHNIAVNGLATAVSVKQCALGDTPGMERWYVNQQNSADGGFGTWENCRGLTCRASSGQMVDISTLDSFGLFVSELDFIKIDVQGFEVSVLRGMRAVIEANPQLCMVVECAPFLLNQGQSPAPSPTGVLIQELSETEFTVYDISAGGLVEDPSPGYLLNTYPLTRDAFTNLLCVGREADVAIDSLCIV